MVLDMVTKYIPIQKHQITSVGSRKEKSIKLTPKWIGKRANAYYLSAMKETREHAEKRQKADEYGSIVKAREEHGASMDKAEKDMNKAKKYDETRYCPDIEIGIEIGDAQLHWKIRERAQFLASRKLYRNIGKATDLAADKHETAIESDRRRIAEKAAERAKEEAKGLEGGDYKRVIYDANADRIIFRNRVKETAAIRYETTIRKAEKEAREKYDETIAENERYLFDYKTQLLDKYKEEYKQACKRADELPNESTVEAYTEADNKYNKAWTEDINIAVTNLQKKAAKEVEEKYNKDMKEVKEKARESYNRTIKKENDKLDASY